MLRPHTFIWLPPQQKEQARCGRTSRHKPRRRQLLWIPVSPI